MFLREALKEAGRSRIATVIAERFETGRVSAADAIKIIGAGLRGGGAKISNEAVAALQVAGGAAGYLSIVARLLTATFASADHNPGNAAALPEKNSPGSA